MRNFLKLSNQKKFKKYNETQLIEWFKSNQKKIFCSGDVEITDQNIKWIFEKGEKTIEINWSEITEIYVSGKSGSNNIYIISADKEINFYVNNRENLRDKFLKYLHDFASMKNANMISDS